MAQQSVGIAMPMTAYALGAQHPVNPKPIAEEHDMVMLSVWGRLVHWLAVCFCVLVAVLGLYLVVDGVYTVSAGPLQRLLNLATHPVAGLTLGIFITAVAQSSSATTVLTIAAVATGSISVPVAIPVIIGANIGTTITPFIAAFSYAGNRHDFSRAFATASLHSWLNLLAGLGLFLVELVLHPLERVSGWITSILVDSPSPTIDAARDGLARFFHPAVELLGSSGVAGAVGGQALPGTVCVLFGALVTLVALRAMGRHLRVLFAATTRSLFERVFKANQAGEFVVGLAGTVLVVASSVTVCALLPFAATRTVRPREALAVILGANVGTTLTGLLAALVVPGAGAAFGLQAALVHVLFNAIAVAVVFAVPAVQRLLGKLAKHSAICAQRGYWRTLAVLAGRYWALPALVFGGFALILH